MKSLMAAAGASLILATAASAAPGNPEKRAERVVNGVFERLDADENGRITETEVKDARRTAFLSADANADGVVEPSELEALRKADRERPRRGRGRFGPRPEAGEALDFARLDTNEDGLLTSDEFVERAIRLLEMDSDGDGAVDKAELTAGVQARMQERMEERRSR